LPIASPVVKRGIALATDKLGNSFTVTLFNQTRALEHL
jgi:xanthine dehydrogenase molybdopterin-binding subunit B